MHTVAATMKLRTSLFLASVLSSAGAWSSSPGLPQRSNAVLLQAISRRSLLNSATVLVGGVVVEASQPQPANAADDGEQLDFGTIASRAAKISQALEEEQENNAAPAPKAIYDGRTAYDFTVPVAGEIVSFGDLVKQNEAKTKVKAILGVNIKQEDHIARKNIPELISLASK